MDKEDAFDIIYFHFHNASGRAYCEIFLKRQTKMDKRKGPHMATWLENKGYEYLLIFHVVGGHYEALLGATLFTMSIKR